MVQFSDKKGAVLGKKGAKLGIGRKCPSLFRGYEAIAASRPGAFKGSQSSGLPASGVVQNGQTAPLVDSKHHP